MVKRSDKVQVEMKKEISRILREDLKDPRVGFITITRIDLTGDLRYARIYFSVLGSEAVVKDSERGIKSATPFIRHLIAERMNLRYTPELCFVYDRSVEYSINLEKTFERIRNEHKDDKVGPEKV